MGTVFLIAAIAGILIILLSLILGDFDASHDGGFPLSPLAIAGGMTLGGGVGLLCLWLIGLGALSLPFAIIAGVGGSTLTAFLRKSLVSQESNSHFDTNAYLSKSAKVISGAIEPNDWGMVVCIDPTGARVETKAYNTHINPLHRGDTVVIHSIDPANGSLLIAPLD